MKLSRRATLRGGLSLAAAATLSWSCQGDAQAADPGLEEGMFPFKFGPHFGMFEKHAGKGLVEQLEFAAEHGFTAWEDNGMKGRPVAVQEQIARAMERLGMEMGVISALRGVWNGVNFAGDDADEREKILSAMRDVVQVAKRVRARYLTVVPGLADPKLPDEYQLANCIELLNRCCDIVEPHGLTMVLEPLNRKTDHPGVLLSESPRAYLLCQAVNRPSCKILFDIYHQQITEGNLIPNIDRCWDHIAYFQCADNPGRNEPGTGEINYANVFRHIAAKGFRGIVGMEHGNARPGIDGEKALIAAYRKLAMD